MLEKQLRCLIAAAKTATVYGLLLVLAAVMLAPLAWMIGTSLKTPERLFETPPRWIPDPITVENYVRIGDSVPLGQMVYNSFKISIFAVIGQVFSCSLAAYVFARMCFPGRDALFLLVLATLMIPQQVIMVPLFILMRELGWVNTHLALIVPQWLGGAFGTFLLRQFFMSIPRELDDAARIDGCNHWDIYWRIMLPLARPALVCLGVFVFISAWNSLLYPLIFLHSWSKMTLTIGLTIFGGIRGTHWELMMAGAVLTTLPTLLVYLVAQRYLMRAIAINAGIKG
jgi:multiple sugar transport system permease protein